MNKEQPEALRLAELIDYHAPIDFDGHLAQAAAELRRLHAENEALRAQLSEKNIGQGVPVAWTTGIKWHPIAHYQSEQVQKLTRKAQPEHGFTIPLYTHPAPQQIGQGEPDGLFESQIEPRPLLYPLSDYHRAMTDGPLHYTWIDKPHRLVYDLIAAVRYYASAHPAPKQKPLTDELIKLEIYKQCPDFDDWHEGPSIDDVIAIIEAVATEPLLQRIAELERQLEETRKDAKPCPTCESLARAVMLDQTGKA